MPFKILPKAKRLALAEPSPTPVPLTLAAAAWIGWLKSSDERWHPVCGAETYAECWDRLLAIKGGPIVSRIVRKKGQRP